MADYDPVEAMLDLTRRLPPAIIDQTLTSLCTSSANSGPMARLISNSSLSLICLLFQARCCQTTRTTCSARSISRSRSSATTSRARTTSHATTTGMETRSGQNALPMDIIGGVGTSGDGFLRVSAGGGDGPRGASSPLTFLLPSGLYVPHSQVAMVQHLHASDRGCSVPL